MLCYAEAKASELEALIGYTFADKCLAAEAVQMEAPHIAVIMDNNFLGLNNNKRLSVLGDAVLAKELSSAWYKARDSHNRVLSQAQSTALRNETLANTVLADRGYDIGIDKIIITAEGTPAVSPKMVATTLEAIIGAVHQDGGDEAAHKLMEHLGFFNHTLLMVTSQPPHTPFPT
ncbi:ribonuclease [Stemphylium lycopersici]|nr:ribonuclease [Stemphylium lycopersici]